jgi:hypothetical protein
MGSTHILSIMASRQSNSSPTLASVDNDGRPADEPEKVTQKSQDPLQTHNHNVDTFERASSIEDTRPALYPVTSYASQVGGEGIFREEELEDIREEGEKDPNLVEWDGPKDPNNPYNW